MNRYLLRHILALCLFAFLNAPAAVRYVDVNSANPTPAYTNWATAATNIQDAVDAAVAGDQILVTNGVYQTGGRTEGRVVVDKPVSMESVNGPQFTIIHGLGEVRCLYLTNGTYVSGFTLTNGVTSSAGGGVAFSGFPSDAIVSNSMIVGCSAFYGGGAVTIGGNRLQGGTLNNCILRSNVAAGLIITTPARGGAVGNCRLNNCTLTGNSAYSGGGAHESLLKNCLLTGNSATGGQNNYPGGGGGAMESTLINCSVTGNSATGLIPEIQIVGGGVNQCLLTNCTLTGNSTGQFGYGGGAHYSALNNCMMTGNVAWNGGGAYNSTLNNCTVTGNLATGNNGSAGGVNNCDLTNCIVYDNAAPNWVGTDNYFIATFNHSCTLPLPPGGAGNITNAPLFVDTNGWANLRLQSNSPCINAGNNASAVGTADLDGRPRIVDGIMDIGAYEFQPGVSGEFIDWLSGYGLPTDGSADYAHSDPDPHNNWQEWIAGTVPTDALSALQLFNPTQDLSGVVVSWQSVSNRTYFLERATNLGTAPPFLLLTSDIAGQAGTTSHTDTNAAGPGPFFYRVGVQQ